MELGVIRGCGQLWQVGPGSFPETCTEYTALRLLPGGDGPAQGDTAVCEDVPIAVGIVVFFTSFIGPRAFDLKEKEHQ